MMGGDLGVWTLQKGVQNGVIWAPDRGPNDPILGPFSREFGPEGYGFGPILRGQNRVILGVKMGSILGA